MALLPAANPLKNQVLALSLGGERAGVPLQYARPCVPPVGAAGLTGP